MEKLLKACPYCPPYFGLGKNVKFVEEENQYKIICQDCGASVVIPKDTQSTKADNEMQEETTREEGFDAT